MTLAEIIAAMNAVAVATAFGGKLFRVAPTLQTAEHLGCFFFPEEEEEWADNAGDCCLRTDTIKCTLRFHMSAGNAGAYSALGAAVAAEQALRTALTEAPSLVAVRPRIGRVRRQLLPGEAQWLESVFDLTTTYREVAS